MGKIINDWIVVEDKTCGALAAISQINMSYYYDGAMIHKAPLCLKEVARFKSYEKAMKYIKGIEQVDEKIKKCFTK